MFPCVSVESDLSDDDTVFDDVGQSVAVTAQSVRWSYYQPKTWVTLIDEQCHKMSVLFYYMYLCTCDGL